MSQNVVALYLQNEAARAINEAVRLEAQGNYAKALERYKDAVQHLSKLIELDPQYKLNEVYIDRLSKCQAKIKEIQNLLENKGYPSTNEDAVNSLILTKPPSVKWEDVIGLHDAKSAIIESVIYPSKRPDLFPLGWPRNILLFGPPGCGKTLLCAAVANEIEGVMFNVDASSLFSKWLGESEKNVANLFNKARKMESEGRSVIIFIDEVDSIFGVQNYEVGGEVRLRNQFLYEMDGLIEKGKNRRIFVIASTNKPWKLDIGFIRRFQLRLYIPPPDKIARINLFKMYSKPLNPSPDVDYEYLASMTENYSGSDIRDICLQVQNNLAREVFEKRAGEGKLRSPNMNDFISVINRRKPTISRELISMYEKWYEEYRSV
ncbi:MAG: AAA family ATPase [Thermoproteota archaeon]|jgi:ATPases of the AAA+ class